MTTLHELLGQCAFTSLPYSCAGPKKISFLSVNYSVLQIKSLVPRSLIPSYPSNSATIERYRKSETILALLLRYGKTNYLDYRIFTGGKAT